MYEKIGNDGPDFYAEGMHYQGAPSASDAGGGNGRNKNHPPSAIFRALQQTNADLNAVKARLGKHMYLYIFIYIYIYIIYMRSRRFLINRTHLGRRQIPI